MGLRALVRTAAPVYRRGPGFRAPSLCLLLPILGFSAGANAAVPAPERPTVTVPFTRAVANVEFARMSLLAGLPPDGATLPAMAGRAWHGQIVRRLDEEIAALGTGHFVPFVVEYVDGIAARAWCDTDLDGDPADAPPLALSPYPAIEGARSFLATLRWTARRGGRSTAVERTIRVVLEPVIGDDPQTAPLFRLQSVFAMLGTLDLGGREHRAFLYDGDGDGLYTRTFADGLFVDLNDDGRFVVDPMGPEFGPFTVPFAIGATSYEVARVDPEGREVVLHALGPAATAPPAPSVGAPAPDFSFTATDGRERRLSDFRGRPVLIYFWSSSCPACASQADRLRTLYDRLGPAGLEILGISYDTDRASMEAFRARHGQSWPTSFSGHQLWEDPIGRLYRERGTGVFYVVNPSGSLVQVTSAIDSIESALTGLLR